MLLPEYWLARPSATDEHARTEFDRLLTSVIDRSGCPTIEFALARPKWQFLCHVAERHDIVLHGSGNPGIDVFEPRQPSDLTEFGNQRAVYAASDGIWAMFFAVVDRDRIGSVANACVRLRHPSGEEHGPFYVFSVSRSALRERPWRSGTVYLLPRRTFVAQPSEQLGDTEVLVAQWASAEPVVPLARIDVHPDDFPFLDRVRGHDDDRLQEYATAMQTGGPWPGDA